MAVTDSVSWEQREGQRMRTAHAAGDPRGGGAAGAGSRAALHTAPVPFAVLPPPLLSALNFSRADSRSGRSGSAAGGAPERAWRAERAGDAGLALQLARPPRGGRTTHPLPSRPCLWLVSHFLINCVLINHNVPNISYFNQNFHFLKVKLTSNKGHTS